jgi:glycolate oxidase iron-sulfur subunit
MILHMRRKHRASAPWLAQLLPPLVDALVGTLATLPRAAGATRVAFHSPCSLQHGLQVRGAVEKLLLAMGAELVPVADGHLCCGSAGTYSLLQPKIAAELGRAKVTALMASGPQLILSANIGCMAQIAGGAGVPVQHWIEWVDARLAR